MNDTGEILGLEIFICKKKTSFSGLSHYDIRPIIQLKLNSYKILNKFLKFVI